MGTEMLLASLKELRRFDVIDVINDSEGKLIKLSRLEKSLHLQNSSFKTNVTETLFCVLNYVCSFN